MTDRGEERRGEQRRAYLDERLQLGRGDTGVLLQEGCLLHGDGVLLVALEGLLQRPEHQPTRHQVQHHHHEHGQHRLPLHDGEGGRAVSHRLHASHHAGRPRQRLPVRRAAHGVLHGGHAGLDKAGLQHAWLDLLRRDEVCLHRH